MENLPAVIPSEPDAYLFGEILHVKKRKFLRAYAEAGGLTLAEQISGVGRGNHYNWIEIDPEYAAAFEKAKRIAADSWESETARRAFHGIDKPIFYKGERVDTVREFSDTLAMFMLNGTRPEKYKTRAGEPEIASRPLTINFVQFNVVNHDPASLSAEGVSAAVLAGDGNGHQAGGQGVASAERQGQNGLKFHDFTDVPGE